MNIDILLTWLLFFGIAASIYYRSHEIFICTCVVVLIYIGFHRMYLYMIDSAMCHSDSNLID